MNIVTATTQEESLNKVGAAIKHTLDTAQEKGKLSEPEFAFLLGHLNMITSLTSVETTKAYGANITKHELCLNYEAIKKAYETANKLTKALEEDADDGEKAEQLSMEDVYPELFQELDRLSKKIEKLNKELNKKQTKNTKKE